MSDEQVMIQATVGPYAGKRLTVSRADADAAFADGWAVDPFSEQYQKRNVADPDEHDDPPKQLSDEDRARVVEAAEKAGRKLRGEPEPGAAEPAPAPERTKQMPAGGGSEYKTRDVAPKK